MDLSMHRACTVLRSDWNRREKCPDLARTEPKSSRTIRERHCASSVPSDDKGAR